MKSSFRQFMSLCVLLALIAMLTGIAQAQITNVGAGSYTTTLPQGDIAPQSTIYTTVTGPVPTHKFWTGKYWYPLGDTVTGNSGSAYHMIPQPFSAYVTDQGMHLGIHGDVDGWNPVTKSTDQSPQDSAFYQYVNTDLTIGTATLNLSTVNVSGSSDWTADFSWGSTLTVRLGRGMPFAYVMTDGTAPTVTFIRTPTVVGTPSNILVVSTPEADARYINYYGLFCPTGGTWAQSGSTFTCNAPGKNYMSVALLPKTGATLSNVLDPTALAAYSKYAFSFPTNTQVSWNYTESTSQVSTTYAVTTQAMEGSETGFLMALYPHQYDVLPGGVNTTYTYPSARGTLEVLTAEPTGTPLTDSFTTVDVFHGILPFMPPTSNYNLQTLKNYVDNVSGPVGSDTYGLGKSLGSVAQVLPLAQMTDATAFKTLQTNLESTLADWFTATTSKSNNIFYYNKNWGSLIGYQASYQSDSTLDDHHFHYGYWIHAAAIDGLYDPTWIATSKYGGMVDLLRQDIANTDRSNTMFPLLRYFDVYAGHSWASGLAPFADGGNEESESEAVNAWAGMILWGAATGDNNIRDAGIWLYTQETKGEAYYWFNEKPTWVNANNNANATSTFPSFFSLLAVANVFDDKGDPGTWFSGEPDDEHAIEYMPFTGGSLYLGLEPSYVQKNYLEDCAENGNKPGAWPDMMEMYEALYNPSAAATQWANTSTVTDGETQAHQYAWFQSLQALGQVDASVTANVPFYSVFNNNGVLTHVAFNPSSTSQSVTFSDGISFNVLAGHMTSDTGIDVTVGPGTATTQAPAIPVGLTATARSSNEIDLTWTFAANVTYTLFRDTTPGFTPSAANQIATGLTSASYNDMSLTAATQYYYAVEAVNSVGASAASTQATATTTATGGTANGSNTLYLVGGATVSTPSSLSFTAGAAGTDSIPSNNPQSPDNPANAIVYTITGLNGTYDNSKVTQFNFYVDAGVNSGTAVQVQVRYDLNGDGTFDKVEQYGYFAMDPVVGFEDYTQTSQGGLESGFTTGSLGDMNNGTVEITIWCALPGGSGQPLSLSVGSTSGAESDLIIPFTNVTQNVSITAPTAPTNLTATGASSSAITLNWTASTSAGVGYVVYRSTTNGFTPSSANQIASGISKTSYSDTGLTSGSTYYYVVAAVNTAGSALSNQASATTLTGGAQAVGNTLYVLTGATLQTPGMLSFDAGTGASSDTLPFNNGNFIGTPTQPFVYVAKGISGTYNSTAVTQFQMFVDAGANAGDGAQVEVLYDLDGDGTFDRTEMYSFFATDPVVGWESYGQSDRGGLSQATGSPLSNMVNGTVEIVVWDALGSGPVQLRTSATSTDGQQSTLTIPFTNVTQSVPPSAPTNLQATAASAGEVDLAWTASSTTGVTYNVYRDVTSGFTPGSGNLLGNVAVTSYADKSVAPSTTYYYAVGAVSSNGSALSSEVNITTPAASKSNTSVNLTVDNTGSIFAGITADFKATISPATATGTVTFNDGSSVLKSGVQVVSGVATFSTSSLAAGSHSIMATYSGDSANAGSTSQPVPESVTAADFAISATATQTVTAGSTATYTVTATPQGNYATAISFSCSGLPSLAACTFTPSTVTPGLAAAPTTLTITTTAATTSTLVYPGNTGASSLPVYAAIPALGLLGLILFGGKARRNRVRQIMLSASTLVLMAMMIACGSSSSSSSKGKTTIPGTPAGTSTVTITATSTSAAGTALTHTTTVQLIVQ